jgi:hypothetical protein
MLRILGKSAAKRNASSFFGASQQPKHRIRFAVSAALVGVVAAQGLSELK